MWFKIILRLIHMNVVYESDSEQTLKAVCDCNGSIKYIHFKCLCHYMKLTKEEICSFCGKQFDVKYLKKCYNFLRYSMMGTTEFPST